MKRCIKFLEKNGWEETNKGDSAPEFYSFNKHGYMGIDINKDEIVLIADEGDIANMKTNYFSLIGLLMEHRQISCGYISIKKTSGA